MIINVQIQLGADEQVLNQTPSALAESMMTAVGGVAPEDACYVTINASGSAGGPPVLSLEEADAALPKPDLPTPTEKKK